MNFSSLISAGIKHRNTYLAIANWSLSSRYP